MAIAPILSGCVSQRKTMDEAIENIKDTVKGYLYVQSRYSQLSDTENLETFVGEFVI